MHEKKEKKRLPNCKECIKKRVILLPENYLILSIIEQYSTMFSDGMGGINIASIRDVVELYKLSDEEKLTTIKLVVLFCKAAKETIGDNN